MSNISSPLYECIGNSNLTELTKKDEEYTQKAQTEGKPFYKWNTEVMTLLIYQNGMNENGEVADTWKFISHWLALELKFIEDEKIQYYMNEFYNGRLHYLDEYYGDTIYKHMYREKSPYVYTLYLIYLKTQGLKMPRYIFKARENSLTFIKDLLESKIPNKNGNALINVSREEAEKYNGVWISPEQRNASRARIDEICKMVQEGKL